MESDRAAVLSARPAGSEPEARLEPLRPKWAGACEEAMILGAKEKLRAGERRPGGIVGCRAAEEGVGNERGDEEGGDGGLLLVASCRCRNPGRLSCKSNPPTN